MKNPSGSFQTIQRLAGFFERRSQKTLIAYAISLTVLLGFFDFRTGVEIHFLLLYLFPIFLGSWFVSARAGVHLAFFASVVWFTVDALGGRS